MEQRRFRRRRRKTDRQPLRRRPHDRLGHRRFPYSCRHDGPQFHSQPSSEVEFQNGIDLTGRARTVQVDDNPNSTGDFATLSGVISDSVGGASFTKTGRARWFLGGTVRKHFCRGLQPRPGQPEPGENVRRGNRGTLNLSAPYGTTIRPCRETTNSLASAVINFNGGYWPHFELLGHAVTVANISDAYGTGVIENTQYETGVSATGVMTVNNSANTSFAGYIRDGNFGGSTGKLAFSRAARAR